mmetsp:Transcript_29772/g.114318  ORF Transcript_29772/g.114318 Transcript_29772/m.114318 type:complete len:97 (+) Transcript_29772:342-632(+)
MERTFSLKSVVLQNGTVKSASPRRYRGLEQVMVTERNEKVAPASVSSMEERIWNGLLVAHGRSEEEPPRRCDADFSLLERTTPAALGLLPAILTGG